MGNACAGVKQKPGSGAPTLENNQGVTKAGVPKPEAKPAPVAPVTATPVVAPKEEAIVAEVPAPVVEVSQPKAQEAVVPEQVAAPADADKGAAIVAPPVATIVEEIAVVQPPLEPVKVPEVEEQQIKEEPEVQEQKIQEETSAPAQNPLAEVLKFAQAQKEEAAAVEEENKVEPNQPLANPYEQEQPAAVLAAPQDVDAANVAKPVEAAPAVAAEPARELTYFERMKLAMEEMFEKKQEEAAAAGQTEATAAQV